MVRQSVRDLSIKNIILGQNFEGNENSSRKEMKDANFLTVQNEYIYILKGFWPHLKMFKFKIR